MRDRPVRIRLFKPIVYVFDVRLSPLAFFSTRRSLRCAPLSVRLRQGNLLPTICFLTSQQQEGTRTLRTQLLSTQSARPTKVHEWIVINLCRVLVRKILLKNKRTLYWVICFFVCVCVCVCVIHFFFHVFRPKMLNII